ncbi:MAG: RecX family transcriptional regulator [Ruminococcus sp.]|nr:RecX family transcriptional regulator [Ruminococcus sp.]
MPLITNIEKYKGKTLRIDLAQGEPVFLNSSVVSDKGLQKGMELTDAQWAEVIYANELRRARERALYLLDIKDYSYIMMFKKLRENYPEQICYDVCDRLAEHGMINDRRYAASLARRYMEIKRFGYFRAVQEMKLKGLSKELIDEALEPYLDSDSVRERICELVRKKYMRRLGEEDGVKKVKNALVRQGYSYSDINAALDALAEEE